MQCAPRSRTVTAANVAHATSLQGVGPGEDGDATRLAAMAETTKWEYATVPLIVHATKQILDQWGEDGWELVQVLQGDGGNLVAYLKRPRAA